MDLELAHHIMNRNADGAATLRGLGPTRFSPAFISGRVEGQVVGEDYGIIDAERRMLLLIADEFEAEHIADQILSVGAAILNGEPGFRAAPKPHQHRFQVAVEKDVGYRRVSVVDTRPPADGGAIRNPIALLMGTADPDHRDDPVIAAAHGIASGLNAIGFDWPDAEVVCDEAGRAWSIRLDPMAWFDQSGSLPALSVGLP